jgi:hypothetical protein
MYKINRDVNVGANSNYCQSFMSLFPSASIDSMINLLHEVRDTKDVDRLSPSLKPTGETSSLSKSPPRYQRSKTSESSQSLEAFQIPSSVPFQRSYTVSNVYLHSLGNTAQDSVTDSPAKRSAKNISSKSFKSIATHSTVTEKEVNYLNASSPSYILNDLELNTCSHRATFLYILSLFRPESIVRHYLKELPVSIQPFGINILIWMLR